MNREDCVQGTVFEVTCEMRFGGAGAPASLVLPGMLFSAFKDELEHFDELPQASIPRTVRETDQNLKYITTHRLYKERGLHLLVGDHAVAVSAVGHYKGWDSLAESVKKVFGAAMASGVLGAIERVSVKYINYFPSAKGEDHLALVNANVRVGELTVSKEPMVLRLEHDYGDVNALIMLGSQMSISSEMPWAKGGDGLVLELDMVVTKSHDSMDEIEKSMSRAHTKANELYRQINRSAV